MLEKWDIAIPALTGDALRNVYVYIPDSCQEDPERHYPVLYMFDGHNVFYDEDATYGKSWGMLDYMDRTGTEMIIAAVECNHSPDGGRLSEYSPFTFSDPKLGHITGRGKTTMDWWVNTFKPLIDSHYPTLPDRRHTFIAGSSMGGLMSLYALLEYNTVFSRAAALSPSIWFSAESLDAMIRNARLAPDTVLYMDYGSREIHFHPNMRHRFGQVASLLIDREIQLSCRIVPGGDHCEASWERQIPFFFNTLLYNLQ